MHDPSTMTLPLKATRKFIHISYSTVCTAPRLPCGSTPTDSMHPTSFTTYQPPRPATHDDAHHSADAALCWPPPSPPVAALKPVPTPPTPTRSPALSLKSTMPEERTVFIHADAQQCVRERMRAPGVASPSSTLTLPCQAAPPPGFCDLWTCSTRHPDLSGHAPPSWHGPAPFGCAPVPPKRPSAVHLPDEPQAQPCNLCPPTRQHGHHGLPGLHWTHPTPLHTSDTAPLASHATRPLSDVPRPFSTCPALSACPQPHLNVPPMPKHVPQPIQYTLTRFHLPCASATHPARQTAPHALPGLLWMCPSLFSRNPASSTRRRRYRRVPDVLHLPTDLTRLAIHHAMTTTADRPSSDISRCPQMQPAPSTCISCTQAPLMHFDTPRPSSVRSHYPRCSPYVPPHALTPARHAPSPIDAFRRVPTCTMTRQRVPAPPGSTPTPFDRPLPILDVSHPFPMYLRHAAHIRAFLYSSGTRMQRGHASLEKWGYME